MPTVAQIAPGEAYGWPRDPLGQLGDVAEINGNALTDQTSGGFVWGQVQQLNPPMSIFLTASIVVAGSGITYSSTPFGPIPTSGTITQLSIAQPGSIYYPGSHVSLSPVLSITGLSIDIAAHASDLYDAFINGDTSGLEAYFLGMPWTYSGSSGNDEFSGGNLADKLYGNGGHDLLEAGGGKDTLSGGDGNDTLDGGLGADYLSGGTGSDRASYLNSSSGLKVNLGTASQNTGEAKGDTYNSIENLTGSNFNDSLLGSAGANRISGANGNDTINGMAGNDVIFGGSGNDRIYGHLGSDTLEGNAGSDTFIFHTALGATNIDTIADFNRAADTIELWNDVFTVLGSGALAASAFKDMAVSAKDASDRIIYNSDTGILYYDADGSGTAYGNVKFAVLTGKPDITASDFVVV